TCDREPWLLAEAVCGRRSSTGTGREGFPPGRAASQHETAPRRSGRGVLQVAGRYTTGGLRHGRDEKRRRRWAVQLSLSRARLGGSETLTDRPTCSLDGWMDGWMDGCSNRQPRL